MRKLIIVLLFAHSLSLTGQSTSIGDSLAGLEIVNFIDTIKSYHQEYNSTNDQFIIYVLYLRIDDYNDTCISLGYIMNSNDFREILPTHYTKVENEYILVRFGENISKRYLGSIDFFKLNSEKQVEIVQKLYPSALGGFTYSSPGMIYCWSGKEHSKIYFSDAGKMPAEDSIFFQFSGDTD